MLGTGPECVAFAAGLLDGIRRLAEGATGWGGLGIISVYSFLIAFVLPLPSEVVLAAPLDLGLPRWLELALIITASGVGKAAGSVVAFRLGHGVREAGPVLSAFERAGLDVHGWSKRQTVRVAKRYGYAGLAVALSVPFFPDTISVYAFSVLGEDYRRFAAATFVGSVGRLLVTLGLFRGTVALL